MRLDVLDLTKTAEALPCAPANAMVLPGRFCRSRGAVRQPQWRCRARCGPMRARLAHWPRCVSKSRRLGYAGAESSASYRRATTWRRLHRSSYARVRTAGGRCCVNRPLHP